MEVKSNKATPFALSDSAKKKILSLQSNEDKRLFRVYVTGGGCSGFQYGFKFDDLDKDEDHILKFDNTLAIFLCKKRIINILEDILQNQLNILNTTI